MENTSYSCGTSGHIMGTWRPQSRTHLHRACVVPACGHSEVKRAEA